MCSKKKSGRSASKPPTHVLALYDFEAAPELTCLDDRGITTPDISCQLVYRRGEQLVVLSETLDWWIVCRRMTGEQRGYVYTGYVAPLCMSRSDKCGDDGDSNSSSSDDTRDLIPCLSDKYVDMRYFPNAPKAAYMSRQRKQCPEEKANIFSVITFWWMTSLIWKGFKRPLVDSDLWSLGETKSAAFVGEQFKREWKKELLKMSRGPSACVAETGEMKETEALVPNGTEAEKEPGEKETKVEFSVPYFPLVKALTRAFGLTFLIGSMFKLCQDLLLFVSPQILSLFIAYVGNEGPQEWWRGYVYALALFGVALVQSLLLHQYFHRAFVTGLRIRTALVGSVYQKMLSISNSARKEFTAGEMVNLMAVDATKLQDITTYFSMIWSAPLQIIGSLYFLYQTMGPSVFAGVGVMVFLIPINMFVSSRMRKLQTAQMVHKDARSKIMNEVLNGMRVLKLYAWEASFLDKVNGIRQQELQKLRNGAYLSAAFSFSWRCAPYLVSIATFGTFVMTGNDLTARKAFVAISLFNILQFPMNMLPTLVVSIIQCQVSLRRMAKFLIADDLDGKNVRYVPQDDDPDSSAVTIADGSFSWESATIPTLTEINIDAKKRSLTTVVGRVGSGKSSLLSAMLGELTKLKGEVTVQGTVAYVPQQAWIQNATLQDNILFGKPMVQRKYDKVIDACALRADLKVLPGGDLTEIGEKGINISGGQKQRISLARAVYANADVYLLDDPLSAVDAHVGKHIFDHVIGPKGLLKRKARVFVTHRVNVLPEVDNIVVMVDGKVSETGTHAQLLNNNKSFATFLRTYLDEEEGKEDGDAESPEEPESLVKRFERSVSQFSYDHDDKHHPQGEQSPTRRFVRSDSTVTALSDKLHHYSTTSVFIDAAMADLLTAHDKENSSDGEQMGEMIKQETSETGRVRMSVFASYIQAVGVVLFSLSLLFTCAAEGFTVSSRIWLADWSSDRQMTTAKRDNYLMVYGILGGFQAVAVLLSNFSMSFGAYHASKNLHNSLLVNIMHCGMSFFETTPIGRIVNRFTKDINIIDELIPVSFRSFLGTLCIVLSTVFVISFATTYFLTVLVPLAVIYIATQRFYVSSSRQLKRLESVTRSPIFSHFLESINGSSTIRAYKQEERFTVDNQHRVNENQVAYYPSTAANRWLAVRLEFVGNLIILFAALFVAVQRDKVKPGLAGLSITYALQVTQTLNWMVRMTSELETNIVAVERVKEYAEVETEAAWVNDNHPPDKWPSHGAIAFKQYSTRYRAGLDLVLKSLDCEISSCEKIGIVGRTGAGKSSIALALFRIIESAHGCIKIDGLPISEMGLHDLRSKLSIIPQDPVLFCGSLRFNLDPFDKHTDAEVWRALEVAHLKLFVAELDGKLEYEISEGGENLSVGQRQLVCLGRALLRRSKVLVLDEATAAVDLKTDDLIQETVRSEFTNCTILTIAHRLNTIMDYDRIMVLHHGAIVEFAAPGTLLSDPSTVFHAMAVDAGIVKKTE